MSGCNSGHFRYEYTDRPYSEFLTLSFIDGKGFFLGFLQVLSISSIGVVVDFSFVLHEASSFSNSLSNSFSASDKNSKEKVLRILTRDNNTDTSHSFKCCTRYDKKH